MKQPPRHILSDCDGVLLRWLPGFERFMDAKGYVKIPRTDNEYNLGKRYNVTYEESRVLVREYNESDLMKDLPPMPGAVEYVKRLNERHGFRFTVITAMSENPIACKNRTENLVKYFGDVFDEVKCLDIGTIKYAELSRWTNSGLFWLEDHVAQAMAGYKLGLTPILMEDPTNGHYDGKELIRAESWKDIYRIICKSYEINE